MVSQADTHLPEFNGLNIFQVTLPFGGGHWLPPYARGKQWILPTPTNRVVFHLGQQ
jgi:hypothetical protein